MIANKNTKNCMHMNVVLAPVETVTVYETEYGTGLTNGYTRGELRNFARVLAKRACRQQDLDAAFKDIDDAIGYLEQLKDNLADCGVTAKGFRPKYSERELELLVKLLTKRSGHGKNAKRKAKDLEDAQGYAKILAKRRK
jgi:hypothetical protein